ncbi:hypothetical protein BGW36DRAFT_432442 [Talaromyces proteolyticus]|uniref:Uncharacterized protein n=1 Tax=Talaromyces proteolyticus TaxID=1131652 RepID=A0AAD4KHQ6_9EURO|nr:uncharacterized protein BGW36DRAFT_432442 [Talaromyces proteolyticus]KAH8690649.1 hypothetical protein BGW36DRAFT_432442 [Talaromyces proteolyticus]
MREGITCLVLEALYNIHIPPSSNFPGPTLWKSSKIVHQASTLQDNLHIRLAKLFDKHGPVVRISSTGLVFNLPQRDGWLAKGTDKWFQYDKTDVLEPFSLGLPNLSGWESGIRRNQDGAL